jgi:surfactin synthase thioesterase subunit
MHAHDPGRPTLLCLPHAGGSAAWYASWRPPLRDCAEVVPVELPGRGTRRGDSLGQSVPELLDAVRPTVHGHTDRPYVLYGHSLGALLAFELAHELAAAGRPPTLLVVSGRNGPSRASELPPVHHLPDAEFLRAIADFAGTPDEVLEDPSLMRLFLPQLRADMRAAETYEYRHRAPLDVPLLVLEGRDDPLVSADGVRAWRVETTAACDVVWYAGGHFFHQRREFAAGALRPRLQPMVVSRRAAG